MDGNPGSPLMPGTLSATPGQKVTAVWSNNTTHLDLFVTDRGGRVMSTWWEGAENWQPWFPIGPAGNAAPGQPVTALWSNPNHLDIFITSADGTVKSTFWEADPAAAAQKGLAKTGPQSAPPATQRRVSR